MFKFLFNPQKASHHPFEVFLLAIIFSIFSMAFASWVFPHYTSVAMIFLTVFSCLYLIQTGMKIEEEKENDIKSEKWALKQHLPLLKTLLALFLGFSVAFTLVAFVLPQTSVSKFFEFQESTVQGIKTIMATGAFDAKGSFSAIMVNNLKVLVISLIFAIFFGAGVMYVLVWNASVMGLVIGTLAKKTFGFTALPLAFTKYFIHGIPEMFAYLIVSLAGGIFYVAIWKGDFAKKGKRKSILRDVTALVGIAVALLIVAAIIEVTISPYI